MEPANTQPPQAGQTFTPGNPETQTPQPVDTPPAPPVQTATASLASEPFEYISNPWAVLKNSFKEVKKQSKLTGKLFLLSLFISFVAVVISSMFNENTSLSLLATVITWGAGAFTYALLLRYAIGLTRGNKVTISELLKSSKTIWLPLFGLMILTGLIVIFGSILLIIPGILFAYWLFFAPYILIDQPAGIVEAMKQSKELARGKFMELVGLWSTVFLINLAPPIAISLLLPLVFSLTNDLSPVVAIVLFILFVPLVIVAAIFYIYLYFASQVALAYRYDSALKLQQTGVAKPPTHFLNWVSFVIIVTLVIVLIAAIAAFVSALLNNLGSSEYLKLI